MIAYENDCVGCATYCIDCGRKYTPHYYCDVCEQEFEPDELYDMDDAMMCRDCVIDSLHKIKEVQR